MEYLLLAYARRPMLTLLFAIATEIGAFAPFFSIRIFEHAKLLVMGAILAFGKEPSRPCCA